MRAAKVRRQNHLYQGHHTYRNYKTLVRAGEAEEAELVQDRGVSQAGPEVLLEASFQTNPVDHFRARRVASSSRQPEVRKRLKSDFYSPA